MSSSFNIKWNLGQCILTRSPSLELHRISFPFTQGYPGNTAQDQNTKRTWTDYTYVVGIADNNYWNPTNVSATFLENNTLVQCVNSSAGYKVGIVFPSSLFAGKVIFWLLPEPCSIVEYTSNGSTVYTIGRSAHSPWTPASTSRWTVIIFASGGVFSTTLAYLDLKI